MLKNEILSIIFTILSIAIFSQATNIIDGLNGLALGICLTIFLSFYILSELYNDSAINIFSLILMGLIFGLLVLNFPFGKIFLGDGGAYFLGILIAVISIIFSETYSQISPFYILLLLFYPIYEILRSIFRRVFLKTGDLFQPDNLHIHSQIYKFFVKNDKHSLKYNSISSAIILIINFCFMMWATFFHSEKYILIIGILLYILIVEALVYFVKKSLIT